MESHQPVMLPNSYVIAESPMRKPNSRVWNSSDLSKEFKKSEEFIGFLEVYIHQARDIHNVCIYQDQDVYAKFCLTSDPETTVSTQIINSGGQNPIFNEILRLNVQSIDSSLKCEIWMLSRIRNYLEDQLLGISSVLLSDVLCGNGKLEREFSLSSSDLFHSPAGFVRLTLTYTGSSPEVLEIPYMSSSSLAGSTSAGKDQNKFDKIEFPDLKIVNENEIMVSEYFRIPCDDLEPKRLGSKENFSTSSLKDLEVLKVESDAAGVSKSPNQDFVVPSLKEKRRDVPIMGVDTKNGEKMVQKEIADMYMKSMQQFTESLAKVKLRMDFENGSATSANNGCDEKAQASKNNGPNPRVFYGSRAFF